MTCDPYDVRPLLPQVQPTPSEQRTRDHRCGRCSWGGTGSVTCPNYRPSQSVPCEGEDDA